MTRDGDPGRDWMLRYQRGDEDSFRRLVEHYSVRVVRHLRRFGADAETARDLCQEVFLRVVRARERYEPTARFGTWLYRIVHRIAMNDAERNRWRRSVSMEERVTGIDSEGVPPPVDGNGSPVGRLQDEEQRQQVREAVAALPDSQRTALLLNRFEGFSYEEVAEAMELQIPAVKSLLFRARCGVRRFLEARAAEEVSDEV